MSGCCTNRYSNSGFKFYRIPGGSRPFQSNRRRLWLQAIKREASMDSQSPDFVPSAFVHTREIEKPEAKSERYHRERRRDDIVHTPQNQPAPSEAPEQDGCSSVDH